jgi:hypothetical protein
MRRHGQRADVRSNDDRWKEPRRHGRNSRDQAGARVSLSRQSLVVVLTVMAPYGTSSPASIRIIVFFIFRKFYVPVPLFLCDPTLYYIHCFNDYH